MMIVLLVVVGIGNAWFTISNVNRISEEGRVRDSIAAANVLDNTVRVNRFEGMLGSGVNTMIAK